MRFTAVDVETANEDLASICQIGLVEYEGTSLVREWKSYVDPEDEFSGSLCANNSETPTPW
jgi:DNA polymerase-3 subunit epsilon